MKRCSVIVLLLTIALLTSACWDLSELEDLAIVAALGIDLAEDGEYEVTAQLIRASEVGVTRSGGGGTGRPFAVVAAKDSSVFGAIRKITTVSPRKLFFSHNRAIILGRELAEDGAAAPLDLLLRDEEPRPTTRVLVATGSAREAIYSVTQLDSIPGIGLFGLLDASFATSSITRVSLHDFRRKLVLGPGFSPILPLVDSISAATIGSDFTPSGSPVSPVNSDQEQILRLIGSAVFKGEKLVGHLSLEETRGYRWVIGDIQSGIVTVAAPQDKKMIDIEILSGTSKLTAEQTPTEMLVKVKIVTSGRVSATESSDDVTSPEYLVQLEQEYAKAITREVELALAKAKEYNTDFLGFGDLLRTQHPRIWNAVKDEWDSKAFSLLNISIEVESRIKRYGIVGKPSPIR